MKIYRELSQFPQLKHAVVSSGTFDGVHIGHQKILRRLRNLADEHQGDTVLITFWPHPRLVLSLGKSDIRLLNTLEEKAEHLAQHGIDHLLVIPFTDEFSQLSPQAFVQKVYLNTVRTKCLVIGYDHRFGRNRAGGFEYLQAHQADFGFDLEEISRQDIDDITISSTNIREALQAGDVHLAQQYLGYAYHLEGQVLHGDKLGREIGFPTANIALPESYKLIPADGIYAVKAHLPDGRNFNAMLYIGKRPTLKGRMERRIEVNIFDFSEDIYGQVLRVSFLHKVREDATFDSLEAMKNRLQEDEREARALLEK